ncbi:MAG TPA: YdcH family protein [Candidatus Acidoferrales bacterium]|nr:YdcH family protein [Candidatus Acidoferrales bacterium]
MQIPAQEIPGDLMAHDAEFQRLAQEHSRYDEQLQQITRQTYLNSEDILLEAQLKKIKLRLKDQMQLMIARNRKGNHLR